MADNVTQRVGGDLEEVLPKDSPHELAMARYKALDLQIDENGVVKLTSDGQRRLFAFGYHQDGNAPKHFASWKTTLAGIELIQGMGMPALHNLEFLYEVGGKLTAMHRLCLAACQATGQLEKHHVIFLNKKNEQLSEHNLVGFEVAGCIVYVRRKGQDNDAIGAFTMDDAKNAGLLGRNKNWQAFAKDMLFHRASYRALAQQFSDILGGVKCKEISELQPMLDDAGRPLTSSDGQQLYQRSVNKQRQAQEAFEALKK